MTSRRPAPAGAKLQLGSLLAELAEAVGRGRADVRRALNCSEPKARKIMSGLVSVDPEDLVTLLDLFEADDAARAKAAELAAAAQRRSPRTPGGSPLRARVYKFEESAIGISSYATELIPGLLQIEDYAEQLFGASGERTPAQVKKLVAARRERSARLVSPDGPQLHFVLGEGAIHWQVGGPKTMAKQLLRLIELQDLPTVTIQVVPFASGVHAALGYAFTLLLQPAEQQDRAYFESLFASKLIHDKATVDGYRRRFAQAVEHALTPNDTSDYLATVAARL
ncbi:Helix-turn-helix domain-containing protein [Allokutzneria albata]|uniref:Helix-turn-helix domain-containing protein n=3 Tax=Allokutzneria albata TaxID=211114 RepID=A0A1G9QX72_ALLAB|nr:Helix-turn-helix domain-containing protein [Allokutzneria albata]